MENEFVSMGKIIGVHGLKGTLKFYSYAESLSVFKPDSFILIKDLKGEKKTYAIKWAKPHGKIVLLCLDGVVSCDGARVLVGYEVFMLKSELPELEEGAYYWFDIIGLDVFTIDQKHIGQVESIIPTGGNDVYVVKKGDAEILIPAVESMILSIDLKNKIMKVDIPEGL